MILVISNRSIRKRNPGDKALAQSPIGRVYIGAPRELPYRYPQERIPHIGDAAIDSLGEAKRLYRGPSPLTHTAIRRTRYRRLLVGFLEARNRHLQGTLTAGRV